jgi:peptidoglycan/LPS O-acetylase OafA/YrhL
LENYFTYKPHLPTLIISLFLVVAAIFLPWLTVNNLALATGTSDWGAMSTIASLIGVGLAFVTVPKVRSLGLIFVGFLAIIGAIIFITRLGGATVGFGLIIEMLLALAAIYIGYLDMSKTGVIATPPPSTPPTTSPPAASLPPQPAGTTNLPPPPPPPPSGKSTSFKKRKK